MAIKNPGPKPRNPKSKPYYPSQGYWKVRIGGKVTTLARWTETDLSTLDRLYEAKRRQLEAQAQQEAEEGDYSGERGETVADLMALFLEDKARYVNHKNIDFRISAVTYRNYRDQLRWVAEQPIARQSWRDLKPIDFARLNEKIASSFGTDTRRKMVGLIGSVFRWARQMQLIDAMPEFGERWRGPSERARREERQGKPDKLFTASHIRAMLDLADDQMKALIYLGINCGYLIIDCAELRISWPENRQYVLDLGEEPYIRFARPKTGERRKCTLWPETATALRKVIGDRTEGRVFLTQRGYPLVHDKEHHGRDGLEKVTRCNPVIQKFRDLMGEAGVRRPVYKADPETGKRIYRGGQPIRIRYKTPDPMQGVAFSSLRTTFLTVAWQSPDLTIAHQSAIHWIMGHKLSGGAQLGMHLGGVQTPKMADIYHQEISLEPLRRVTDAVRHWLLNAE